MPSAPRLAAYDRKSYLATVAVADRPLAERLCRMLEKVFPGKGAISMYGGFPVAMRDGEWLAGFAMRKRAPMIYLCSPAVHAELGDELKPFMGGKSCLELRPRGGVDLAALLKVVERAFRVAARSPGLISKADRRKRDAARAKVTPERRSGSGRPGSAASRSPRGGARPRR
jgi:hypothetical protein